MKTATIVAITVIFSLVLYAGIVGLMAASLGEDEPGGPTEAPEVQQQEDLTTTGQDGKFEFTVTAVECGATTIGDPYLQEEAQGEFCMVDLTVENVGSEPQFLDVTAQRAIDTTGNEHQMDDTLTTAVENPEVWYNNINPGNSVTGTMVVDVPEGTELEKLRLHDSAFSGGAEVAVP